jgi:AraC-like DNA-binding protein
MNPVAAPGSATKYWHDAVLGMDLLRATFTAYRFPFHTHETYVVAAIQRGAERFRVQGITYVAPAGSVIVLPPDTAHDGEAATPNGYSYVAFYPNAVDVEDVARELGAPAGTPSFAPVLNDARLNALIVAAHAEMEGGDRVARETARIVALRELIRRSSSPQRSARRESAPSPHALDGVRDLIDACYCEPLSIGRLSREVGCSPSQLMRGFKARFGVSVHVYIIQFRLRQARRLLVEGLAAADVALAVGFSDQSHLARRFRQTYGVTPGSYVRHSRMT